MPGREKKRTEGRQENQARRKTRPARVTAMHNVLTDAIDRVPSRGDRSGGRMFATATAVGRCDESPAVDINSLTPPPPLPPSPSRRSRRTTIMAKFTLAVVVLLAFASCAAGELLLLLLFLISLRLPASSLSLSPSLPPSLSPRQRSAASHATGLTPHTYTPTATTTTTKTRSRSQRRRRRRAPRLS